MARPLAGLIPAAALLAGAAAATTAAAQVAAPAPFADRYGPTAAAPTPSYTPAAYAPARSSPAQRLLSWPGKAGDATIATTPPPAPIAPMASARVTRSAPWASPRPWAALASRTSAPQTVNPVFAAAPSAPVAAAPPPPYFAAPGPGTPPPASTALAGPVATTTAPAPAGSSHVRMYSVHREYGLQPDPAPIPPQFFAATPDLSAPATADAAPARGTNTAARNAVNAQRLAAGAAD